MSNSHAHMTTISQRSSTEWGLRNHITSSAARLSSHTPETTAIIDRGVAARDQKQRKKVVPGGDGEDADGRGRKRADDGDRNVAGDVAALRGQGCEQRVADQQQRKPGVPEHVKPDRGLRTGSEKSGRREQARKRQHVGQRNDGGEQVSADQQQQLPRAQDHELGAEQHRGDQVGQRERRLIAGDESRRRREFQPGKGHRRKKGDARDRQDDQGEPAIDSGGGGADRKTVRSFLSVTRGSPRFRETYPVSDTCARSGERSSPSATIDSNSAGLNGLRRVRTAPSFSAILRKSGTVSSGVRKA